MVWARPFVLIIDAWSEPTASWTHFWSCTNRLNLSWNNNNVGQRVSLITISDVTDKKSSHRKVKILFVQVQDIRILGCIEELLNANHSLQIESCTQEDEITQLIMHRAMETVFQPISSIQNHAKMIWNLLTAYYMLKITMNVWAIHHMISVVRLRNYQNVH